VAPLTNSSRERPSAFVLAVQSFNFKALRLFHLCDPSFLSDEGGRDEGRDARGKEKMKRHSP
jgi:hypothetical protein